MRELPEPDGDHDRVFERGTVVYTRESVLAIQKQAYEDGLRDAGKDAERYRWLRSPTCKMAVVSEDCLVLGGLYMDQKIDDAMLTASQKEQQ